MTGAEALKRACLEVPAKPKTSKRPSPPDFRGSSRENHLVDEAFKLVAPVVKGWLRSRVRAGSSLVESVAKLSSMLQAGESIVSAAGGIARAIQGVRKAIK